MFFLFYEINLATEDTENTERLLISLFPSQGAVTGGITYE